jgi:hypothetical protein
MGFPPYSGGRNKYFSCNSYTKKEVACKNNNICEFKTEVKRKCQRVVARMGPRGVVEIKISERTTRMTSRFHRVLTRSISNVI